MLKVIYQLFVIVLIFGLVSGGIYAYVNSSGGQAALGQAALGRGGFDGGRDVQTAAAPGIINLTAGINTAPRGDFGGRDFRGGGNFSLAGIGTNLAEIGMITVLVVLVQKGFKKARRRAIIAG